MSAAVSILLAVGKIFGFILAGFFLFKIGPLKRTIDVVLKIILNICFPVYFIHSLALGWDDAVRTGWIWMGLFFFTSLAMIGLQFLLGRFAVKKLPVFQCVNQKELVTLIAVQNAGYIPLPIIRVLAPRAMVVYMFFYFLAFNIIFWSVIVSTLSSAERGKFTFRLNMPLIGIFAGILIAISGVYRYVPDFVGKGFSIIGEIALNGVLVMLGAILSTIPIKRIRFSPLFIWTVVIKMILYPAVFLFVFHFVHIGRVGSEMEWAIKMGLVLEAAVPPATNILIGARAYGSKEQEIFISNGIIHTYAASMITLPIFLILSTIILK